LDEILAWERRSESERDTRFVELGPYLFGEDGRATVKHARYYWLLLAEGYLNRRRFGAMLGRTALLPVPTG
jgi:hypothetical protein